MIAAIHSSDLDGCVMAPRSKSVMQRACAAALIAGGETILMSPGNSLDDQVALSVIQQLGATVERLENGTIKIISSGIQVKAASMIDCGESGLSLRLFTAIAALSDFPITMTGKGSLQRRPQDFLLKGFPEMGVDVQPNNGYIPFQIKGPLLPTNVEVDGSMSSQHLTGLLMAYAAKGAAGVTITVQNLVGKPYIDLTIDLMKQFGLTIPINQDYKRFIFYSNGPVNSLVDLKRNFNIEGDWSGAAFLLVAGAITGSVQVEGLSPNSYQADKKIIVALQLAGAGIEWENEMIQVQRKELNAFHFDATECPDLFPPLVALAAFCNGETKILGANRLKHKESDRAATLVSEFSKLGLQIKQEDDCLLIQGVDQLVGGVAESQGDHRIAMALAVAGLRSKAKVVIHQAESVAKSYPLFFDDLAKLGASVSLTPEN